MLRPRFSITLLLALVTLFALPAIYWGSLYRKEIRSKKSLANICFSRGELAGYFLYATPEYSVDFSHDEFLQREEGRSRPTFAETEALNVRCLFEQPDYSQSEFSSLPPMGDIFSRTKANQAAVNQKGWLDEFFDATWQLRTIRFVSTAGYEPGDSAYVIEALDDVPNLEGVMTRFESLPKLAKTKSAGRVRCLIVGGSCTEKELESLAAFPELRALLLVFYDPTKSKKVERLTFLRQLKQLRILQLMGTWSRIHSGHNYLQESILQDIAELKSLESLTLNGRFTGEGLAQIQALENLKELRFLHSKFSRSGLDELRQLQQLKYLTVRGLSSDADWMSAMPNLEYLGF